MEWLLVWYLVIMNLVGFFTMGIDKVRAKRKQWRIPEKTFFIIAFLGGGLGTWLGMYYFRHKTKHWYFVVGIPVILLIEVVLFVVLLSNEMM